MATDDEDPKAEEPNLPARLDEDDDAQEEVEELLAQLPEDTDPDVKKAIAITLTRHMHHSGPLPSPQALEHYMRLMPDAGNRIFTMAETEQKMRGSDNTKIIHNDRLKIVGSFLVSLALVGAGIYCGVIGQPWLGGVLGTSGAVNGIVRAVWGQPPEKANSDQDPS